LFGKSRKSMSQGYLVLPFRYLSNAAIMYFSAKKSRQTCLLFISINLKAQSANK
jgi:hypothetical protein